jgi:photosystem II stability/assembly factor-like uncharacterized protein
MAHAGGRDRWPRAGFIAAERFMYPKYVLLTLAAVGALSGASTHAAPVADPIDRPAMTVRAPDNVFLDGLARAGKRLVAVGEHGIIVWSDDDGRSWHQAKVPTSVTLTAVQFPTPRQGWAVGHSGVVLHSENGGETWSRQLDGVEAARLALRDAAAGSARVVADARRLVQDGPDKPFLALHFTDALNGFIVGAYNLAFRTRDGGKTWTSLMRQLDNPKGNHLYAVRAKDNNVYIAGEQGLVLRSTDTGQRFERLDTGYKGSFFAMALRDPREVVVAGLRGNAYRSLDGGITWDKLDVPAPFSITAIANQGAPTLLFANQAGQLFELGPGTGALVPLTAPTLPPLNDVLAGAHGSIIAASVSGIVRLPAATVSATAASSVSMAEK